MWCSYNRDEHNNSDKPVPLPIPPIQWDAEKVLFTMCGDQSLGFRSRNTSYYSDCRRNDDDVISEEEGMEVSLGEESCGHMSLETSHFSQLSVEVVKVVHIGLKRSSTIPQVITEVKDVGQV